MTIDPHAVPRKLIDDAVVAKLPPENDPMVREHLQTCELCREYLDTSTRVLAGLDSFRFEVDPSLESKVGEALRARAEQLKGAAPLDRGQLIRVCVLAVLFAAAGSVLDLQIGKALVPLLPLRHVDLRQDLLLFWVIPSLLPLLLFPLLPALASRKERFA